MKDGCLLPSLAVVLLLLPSIHASMEEQQKVKAVTRRKEDFAEAEWTRFLQVQDGMSMPTLAPIATTVIPSLKPTEAPIADPTNVPTASLALVTAVPTAAVAPTATPSLKPTEAPIVDPTNAPTESLVTAVPTTTPTANPTSAVVVPPTQPPTDLPVAQPTTSPTTATFSSAFPTTWSPSRSPVLVPEPTTAVVVPTTTDPPTSTPSALPTPVIPVETSAAPTLAPIEVSTSSPTQQAIAPTGPLECPICPSAPTVVPSNDACIQAISLSVGGAPMIGNTNLATSDTRANDVVYQFVGNGRRVRVSTCFDETTTAHNFVLRNGGCGSGGFGERSNDPTCAGSLTAAAYEFDSVAGRTYPIFVYPRNPGRFGQFAIQVTDYVSPANDYCEQAETLQIGAAPVSGSTINATQSTRTSDVVYQFVGNGRRVRVSTCFDETTTPHNFILRNGGCGSGGFGERSTDTSCPGNVNAAAYEFDSVAGRTYPIFVYPRNPGQDGEFAIQVSDSVSPPNDNCAQAETLQIGAAPVSGSTINATQSTRASDVVYQFVGNGRRVRVSTCFDETTTPHNFILRNGGCGSGGFGERSTDSSCPGNVNAAAYEFDSVTGQTYPIFVYPRNPGQDGEFVVQVTDYISPANDNCAQAETLQIGAASVSGSTINATASTRTADVVYQFVGNGQRVRVSTCSEETTTPHNIILRNGGCGSGGFGETGVDFACPGNVNAAAYEFDSVAGRTYPVFVYPRNARDQGSFQIRITEVPASRRLGASLSGWPLLPRIDEVESDFEDSAPTVSTALDLPERSVLLDFDLGPADASTLIVDLETAENGMSVDAATVDVAVPGSRFLQGIAAQHPCTCPSRNGGNPYNDDCEQYQTLEINYAPLIGSTVNATDSTRPSDVVYSFVGNGRRVRVSTCFDETATAHNFLLRNGGCGSGGFGESSIDPSCVGNAKAAAYEFDTVSGRAYPIFLYPRNPGQQGQFSIQVTDYVSPANDNCDQGQSLEIGGAPVIGSTINATQSTRASDVVYSFVGNGRRVRVSTCFDETSTPHNFLLRNGGCGSGGFGESSIDASCAGNANAAAYEFDTVSGRAYPIFVYPRNPGQQGQFSIQVTDYVSPANDNCDQGQSLEIGGAPVIGTTINATHSTRASDVVYSFVGNGRRVRVSTCFDETSTPHNFLLRNGGCGSGGFGESSIDASCAGNANAAAYEFDTVSGRAYPIFLYPRNPGQQGQFSIQVTDYVSPANDNCDQGQSLEIGGAPVIGSTINATQSTRASDVVYSFVGNGAIVRISTCFDETTAPHNFILRNGGCGSGGFGESSSDAGCGGNANAAAYEFETVSGRFYPIFIYPRNPGQQGQFAIQVDEVS